MELPQLKKRSKKKRLELPRQWGVWSWGGSGPRGVVQGGVVPGSIDLGGCLLLGGCAHLGEVWSGGVSAPGGSGPGGVGIPVCTEADPHLTCEQNLFLNEISDRCKNITSHTMATTSLRPVTSSFHLIL